MQSFARALITGILSLAGLGAGSEATAQVPIAGDATHGKIFFERNCALCHADTLGPGNAVIVRQGPSLVGVFGRPAGTGSNFTYTKAMVGSGMAIALCGAFHIPAIEHLE
jgi:cytochrome c2